ncbi:inositol phospholipid synthesis and fat-storage-inducing TM-domain-containing protein [Russula brevipes]|nr:inositol phospholipid synthesis and fat-storage-inducing TM-domain-containing protein [Russula brevipes]
MFRVITLILAAVARSLLNVVFLKWTWAWTTAAFVLLLFSAPAKRTRRFLQWVFASAAWYILTAWFFGPSLLTRLTAASGGECGLHMGQGFVPIPPIYCSIGTPVARSTHPELFPVVFVGADAQTGGPLIPRLHRGHDVSGHVFLLTLAALFLADQLRQTRSGALLSLWIFSLWVTSAFFHVPSEKLSGFGASLDPIMVSHKLASTTP